MHARPDEPTGRRRFELLPFLLASLLLCGVAVEMSSLFGVARALTIDYFDSFEYLANARILVEQGSGGIAIAYHWRRPPVVSIAQAIFYPTGRGIDAALGAFQVAHVLAWGFSACALAALYVLLRREFDRTSAALGVVLFAANPMFLHLVPFALVDVPAMLATTIVLATYLFARERTSLITGVACGLALTVAMATKYNLLLLAPCLLAFEAFQASVLRNPSPLRAALSRRTLGIVLVGAAGWLVLHSALRLYVEGRDLASILHIFETFLEEFDYVGVQGVPVSDAAFPGWDDPKSEYLEELFQVTPFALIAATGVGFVLAIRRGTAADRLHLVWLVTFLLVMSFGILTKASRYLLPILPSVIHFQLRGLGFVRAAFVHAVASRVAQPRWRAACVVLGTTVGLVPVLWLPIAQARVQLAHFEDPIYRMTFIERLVRQLSREVKPGAPIFWRGNLYSIYPEEPVFFPHDEAFYFYHLGVPMLEFFLNRPIGTWEFGRPYRREELVDVFPSDGAVVTHEDRFQLTHLAGDLPSTPVPLRVDVFARRTFAATGRSRLVLKDQGDATRQVRLASSPEGYSLPGNFPGVGWHALYRETEGARAEALVSPLTKPPYAIELLRVDRSELHFRE